ncbi:MAG: antiporter, partial [Armatimonadetes bacterium]|nr:antiporter [Armatimonadota bacterium]
MSVPQRWEPEDADFWTNSGSRLANRNLWLSTGCLMMAFAVWMVWSVITVQMQALGFPFSKEQLYSLTAIAGLAGATLRIPQSFVLALSGGRVVIAVTTALLLLPAVGLAIALRSVDTPFGVFAALAALSGLGGGNFASSMANISLFFPKRQQGMALGINAGVGNLGLSLMQVALPLVMGVGLFGALGGEPLQSASGKAVWLQNAGLLWVLPVGLLALLAWLRMNTLPVHAAAAAAPARAVGQVLHLTVLGLLGTALGVVSLLSGQGPWLVLPTTGIHTTCAASVR